eukprot:CAMPEP_0115109642 /NCGR_PEP_ID=MMETSP0227-20121206/38852_1 /TAXON_ID=89957 /ORGANISM="Polarella glacialis, Strain CCMP 1383" /LENGTH=40 /DNA_ID= /DNA_START= /DNA_END= /DNA_ORIENTATION=
MGAPDSLNRQHSGVWHAATQAITAKARRNRVTNTLDAGLE